VASFDGASGAVKHRITNGTPNSDGVADLALASSGDLLLAGWANSGIVYGPKTFAGPGAANLLVVQLTPNLGYVDGAMWGSPGIDTAASINAQGSAVSVCGDIEYQVDFGGGAVGNKTLDKDAAVLGLDPLPNHAWSVAFGDAKEQYCASIAVDGEGNSIIGGLFAGTMTIGSQDLVATAGVNVMYVAKLSKLGTPLWAKAFPSETDNALAALAVDATGNIIATGWFDTAVDFGGGVVTPSSPQDGADGFVLKLTPSGSLLWVRQIGGGNIAPRDVACATDGRCVVAGLFSKSITAAPFEQKASTTYQGFLLALEP